MQLTGPNNRLAQASEDFGDFRLPAGRSAETALPPGLETLLRSARAKAVTALLLPEIRERFTEEVVDWTPKNPADAGPLQYKGSGFSPDGSVDMESWRNWARCIAANGEAPQFFSEVNARAIANLPAPVKAALISELGGAYQSFRKLYNDEEYSILPPRRAADLTLSLLFNPHECFARECNQPAEAVYAGYLNEVQRSLNFGEKYGLPEVQALCSRVQDELRHHLALIEELDTHLRNRPAQVPKPPVRFGTLTNLFSRLTATSSAVEAKDFGELMRLKIDSVEILPPDQKSAFLASKPFRASEYQGPVIVTGSFPQGRSYVRGSGADDADAQRRGKGDIDIVPPPLVASVWCQHSLKHRTAWSERPIGKAPFSTFAGNPGSPIKYDGPGDSIWLYRSFSPIALHVFQSRTELVIYPIGRAAMSSSRPFISKLF